MSLDMIYETEVLGRSVSAANRRADLLNLSRDARALRSYLVAGALLTSLDTFGETLRKLVAQGLAQDREAKTRALREFQAKQEAREQAEVTARRQEVARRQRMLEARRAATERQITELRSALEQEQAELDAVTGEDMEHEDLLLRDREAMRAIRGVAE